MALLTVVLDPEPLHTALHCLFQIQFDLVLDVAAGLRARPRSPAPRLLLAAAPEKGAEEVGERALVTSEHVGDFLLGHRTEAGAARGRRPLAAKRASRCLSGALRLLVLTPVRAQLVVFAALFRIAEHLVGLVDLLEAGLRRLVARIDVGVVLPGELAERLLDLFFRGGFADAKRRVVILEVHRRSADP